MRARTAVVDYLTELMGEAERRAGIRTTIPPMAGVIVMRTLIEAMAETVAMVRGAAGDADG